MDGAGGTVSLRKEASSWSLAGDKQLLELLQNIHERIVTKCQEANSSLQEMVNDLDTASISLQNVNNRLMALSNSQFVESRVYDDDVDVATTETPVKEPPKAVEVTSELSKLRDSLRVLEAYHEPVHIMDSDSESGSDDEEDRMVFKPKDLYAARPLPYIIGSQQWRNKWHAGLVAEDSDSDSDTSKVNPPSEQYSDSDRDDAPPDKPSTSQRTISTTSSIGSEVTIPAAGKPADIAAELARRLGGNAPHIPEPEPEPESPPVAAPVTVYRPQQPVTANIFSEEPPPLDVAYHSEQSDSEDDVFAELHRQSAGTARLFGNVSNVYGHKAAFEDDDDTRRESSPSAKQPSPLFEEPKDPNLFADKSKREEKPVYAEPETLAKKPKGGISLFGNNQGAESIGAAILKRNQRKVSSSDEEIEQPQKINRKNDHVENSKGKSDIASNSNDNIQKDIINDLFSKPNKTKKPIYIVENKSAVEVEKPVNKKVDLFNDDLFDDIDDIFTDVKPPVKESKESIKKSLFDDDDDGLFANIAVSSNKSISKAEPKSKSIFDSDDDLFNEQNKETDAAEINNIIKNNRLKTGESDNINNQSSQTKSDPTITTTMIKKQPESDIADVNNHETIRQTNRVQEKTSLKYTKAKSIFDSDSDDDIFSDLKPSNDDIRNIHKNKINVHNKEEPQGVTDEDALFLRNDSSILRKINSNSSGNSEIKINNQDQLVSDNSVSKQIEKPVGSNEESVSPHIDINDTNNKLDLDKFDNNKKTDKVLTKRIETTLENEKKTIIFPEDKLLPSTNDHDNIKLNKEVSTIVSNPNKSNTRLRSPSLFDDDDDLDDIFTKPVDSRKSKKVDDKLDNNNPQQPFDVINNHDKINENKLMDTKKSNKVITTIMNKSDVDDVSNVNSVIVDDNQIIEPNKTEISLLNNDELEVSNVTKVLRDEVNTHSSSNTLQGFAVPRDTFEHSVSVAKESNHEEGKEHKIDNFLSGFTQNEQSLPEEKKSASVEPDIFSDIFSDIPPEFERPKEPKKSKNINALFDDDSDDETLFFKKNEIVTDEKPDVSFGSQDDRLFNIFHDEPPAMDVDFTQKSKKSPGPGLETLAGECYSEMIPPQIDFDGQENVKSLLKQEKCKEPNVTVDPESEKIMDEAKKPVGKLKPMNFNINVSTLLPGASPKKTKTYEQVDGQVISTKSTGDMVDDEVSKMVKSVSFDGDPESEVLDNKLSKERAKIQVKRRPSTRRARKEAVRKSGIDFGDDSTDNSSSTDISKNDNYTKSTIGLQTATNTMQNSEHTDTSKKEDTVLSKSDFKDVGVVNNNILDHNEDSSKLDVLIEKKKESAVEGESQFSNNVETNITATDNSISDEIRKEVSDHSNLTTTFNRKSNVKSKVVYILHDEDIFTDAKPVINVSENKNLVSENAQNVAKSKVLNIVDDDDELFKSSTNKNTAIASLGNVYKDANLKTNEIDNFDSDENIFKASQSQLVKNIEPSSKSSDDKGKIDKLEAKIDELFVKTQSNKASSSLFDDLSEEESELFGNKKSVKNAHISGNSDGIRTLIKKEVKLPKTDVKGSLFGDESDDDDLFGVKTAKKVSEFSRPVSKSKETSSTPSEPVFADPLSILGQDDDI